jgi:hypothetical protein
MEIKKAWMTATIFTEFLRVMCASIDVRGRNILSFVDNCTTHSHDTSFLWNIKLVLSAKLHKHYAFHEDWIWLNSEKDVNFSSYTCVTACHMRLSLYR